MKTLMVIIDGLGDEKITNLSMKTPFEASKHLNIDKIAMNGIKSKIDICGDDFIPESLGCILRMLGVSNKEFPQNRACLELLAQNIELSNNELALRANLVSIDSEGELVSFNAMGLSDFEKDKACKLVSELNNGVSFIHLSSYKNTLIIKKEKKTCSDILINPPHESVGGNYFLLMEELIEKNPTIKTFLETSAKVLEKFSRNGVSYRIYPWGVSERTELKSFYDRFKLKGAVVCNAEIVKGMAIALGMDLKELIFSTGDYDTNLIEKAEKTIEALKENDFVLTHFNGTDELSHRYDYQGKVKMLERIDNEFFKKIINEYKEPVKIWISGDHGTSSITGKHLKDPVPYVAGVINGNNTFELKNARKYEDVKEFIFGRSD